MNATPPRRASRHLARGLSLLEAMSSGLVLGVAVMGVVAVVDGSARGRYASRQRAGAVRAAELQLEALMARGAEALPPCSGQVGCRAKADQLHAPLAPANGYPCTRVMAEPSLAEPGTGESAGRLRVDTVVEAHPDPDQRSEGRLVTVSACWLDASGGVHEHRVRQLILDRRTAP